MIKNWTQLLLIAGLLTSGISKAAASEIHFSDFMQAAAEEQSPAVEPVIKPVTEADIKTVGEEELVTSDPSAAKEPKTTLFAEDEADDCACSKTKCGSSCTTCGSACSGCCDSWCEKPVCRGSAYAEIDMIAMRAHVSEELLGKLSEKYEFSQRYIVGYQNAHGIGGRVRWWDYDRETQNRSPFRDDLRLDFDIVDVEGTLNFGSRWWDVVIAGGIRYADLSIEVDDEQSRNEMPGATFAVDFRTIICGDCNKGVSWSSVGGARWSVMGGDWEGDSNGLIEPTRDDNITAQEIYGGFECRHTGCKHSSFARLVFEAQNWRSDALEDNTSTGSIGFIGPRVDLGFNF